MYIKKIMHNMLSATDVYLRQLFSFFSSDFAFEYESSAHLLFLFILFRFSFQRHDGMLSSSDEAAYYGLLSVVDDSLLPSLSLQPGNCCMAEELWALVRHYPYEIR